MTYTLDFIGFARPKCCFLVVMCFLLVKTDLGLAAQVRFYSVTPTASLLHEEQLAAVLAGLRALCL